MNKILSSRMVWGTILVMMGVINGAGCAVIPETKGECLMMSEQANQSGFEALAKQSWSEVFFDPCTGDWNEHWMLDGEKARIENGPEGMDFFAGDEFGDDGCHAVLWTKEWFKGDVKIEFDYTRLDSAIKCVNIVYIEATGSGVGPYKKDIAEWAELRKVPAMKMYFDHMNTYHISYAAWDFAEENPDRDYIRARRYMPELNGLDGTGLQPDNFGTGLFHTGEPHKMTIIKHGSELYLLVKNTETERLCHWSAGQFPPIEEGRIGLRHMFTRSARYRNIRISTLD